jgi:Fe-S-cluster containining protein
MTRKPAEPPANERSKCDQPVVEGHTSSECACFDLTLRIGLEQVRIRARIPQGPISIPEFLPIVQSLTDAVMAAVARGAKREQRLISCGPGCGACCRQLVPIGEAEAIYLKGMLDGLYIDRRARIQERFGIAEKKLREGGLLDVLRSADKLQDRDGRREIGLRYFRLGIPCPFLEDESCGIHPHRPLACREYVVTSNPRHCARPATGRVETLELPRRPSALFYRFGDGAGSAPARWLALPLALEWTQSRAVQNEPRTFFAPELFTAFVRQLANAEGEDIGSPGIGHR